jgi:hypothetical protein
MTTVLLYSFIGSSPSGACRINDLSHVTPIAVSFIGC